MPDEPSASHDVATIRAAVDRLFVVQPNARASISIMDALANLRWMLGDGEFDRDLLVSMIRERAAELNRRLVP